MNFIKKILERKNIFYTLLFLCTLIPSLIFAEEGGHGSVAFTFFGIAILLMAAKLGGLIERFGQPSVLGELIIGVIIGNLGLVGFHFFDSFRGNEIISFLAELGVVILLFQIGLESNIQKMREVGLRAFLVAAVGVILPFVLGTYVVGPLVFPGLQSIAYLFLGASLTATSVGITARVFKDLHFLKSNEAQIVLGAAVIDDVLGLIILAVVSAIASAGSVSLGVVSWITAKAVLFLVGAIVLGYFSAPYMGRLFSKIHTGIGMKFTLAISFCLVFAYVAGEMGLAPIVGAFAAGLVLDPVHFAYFKDPHVVEDVRKEIMSAGDAIKEKMEKTLMYHSHRHIEDLIEPLSFFLVPLFFVITGMGVRIETILNLPVLLTALGITIAAFIGKIAAGMVAGKVKKWVVGWGMVPRGEVGLIFATIGKTLGVINDELFSVIIVMVVFTTLFTPPILASLIKKVKK
jgi:Kef-type K+ transport system membrane component KefB